MRESLDLCRRTRENSVRFITQKSGKNVSRCQTSSVKHPTRGVRNHDIAFRLMRLVHDADELIFRTIDRIHPEWSCGSPTFDGIRMRCKWIQFVGLLFIANQSAILLSCQRAGLEPRLPVADIGSEKTQVDTLRKRCFQVVAHLPRPILVVAHGKKCFVPNNEMTSCMSIDIRCVGDVVAFVLEKTQ